LQEEAPSLGKFGIARNNGTTRSVTAGTAKLVGTEPAQIIAAATQLLKPGNIK